MFIKQTREIRLSFTYSIRRFHFAIVLRVSVCVYFCGWRATAAIQDWSEKMDLAKLDKMKVVDLRTELQTRGLDTKGVKAVLIERLRAHVEGTAGGDGGKSVCVCVFVYASLRFLVYACENHTTLNSVYVCEWTAA